MLAPCEVPVFADLLLAPSLHYDFNQKASGIHFSDYKVGRTVCQWRILGCTAITVASVDMTRG